MTPAERRLKTALMRNSGPDALGAIECAVAGQILHSGLYSIVHSKDASQDHRDFARRVLPLSAQAAREPFLRFPRNKGDELIGAAADVSMLTKQRVIGDRPVMMWTYFLALYHWLSGEIERGTLTLHPGSAFDRAWTLVAEQVVKAAGDDLDAADRSARKRARRYAEVMREFGLFTAGQPVSEAA